MKQFESFPLIVGWELTLACNLHCEHCGSTAGQAREGELSPDEALRLCDQFPDLLVSEVDFTGGEPLVRRDWWNIAIRLKEMGIKTKLITNGVLLDEETADRMKTAGLSRVGVSIDGLEQTHDRIRNREGLFAHIVDGVQSLVKAGMPVSVVTTVNALNIDELPALLNILESLGADIWQFQPVFPLGRARGNRELTLSKAAYLRLGRFAAEHSSWPKPKVTPGDSFGYYTDLDPREPRWGGCSAGLDLCGITSDGRVKGCLSMPDEFTEGNLRERDLWDIWFDEDAFSYNRKFTSQAAGPNCRDCRFLRMCRGGCTSMSYACTGKFNNDPYCLWRLAGPFSEEADLRRLEAW